MYTRSQTILTKTTTKEQMWRLFADVNNWHTWDNGIEYARLEGPFEKGNFFKLKPKGGPELKVALLETVPNHSFLDVTSFPLARMYDQHTFEETPEGLRITNTITVKGILSFLWVKLVAQNIVNGLPAEMQKQVETAAKL